MSDPGGNGTRRSAPATGEAHSGAPHRSIGEVLAMLQSDYPDITVSKIRFLETQGLISPERTPSGYRKFHDHDVEQLRWILRQQKDNFLPLKVIKQRLAAGQLEGTGSAGVLDFTAVDAPDVGAEPGCDGESPNGPADANTASDNDQGVPGDRGVSEVVPVPAGSPVAGAAPGGDPGVVGGATGSAGGLPVATNGAGTLPPQPPVESVRGGVGDTEERVAGSSVSSVALGASELCAAAGISRSFLAELERLGMVAATDHGGVVVYGDDALVVARLAAGMSAHGLEARHLRGFKVAADREAGLYEQLAAPRMVRADTQAKRAVADDVAALADLGARLHDALLNRALRTDLRRR